MINLHKPKWKLSGHTSYRQQSTILSTVYYTYPGESFLTLCILISVEYISYNKEDGKFDHERIITYYDILFHYSTNQYDQQNWFW